MISDWLSFGLDVVILLALGVTIFFAVRLSTSLKKFRMHREEFNQYMAELGKNIEAAEDAIDQLKQASLATGDQLRRKVREGQHLHDELEIMIETAGNIADRLEQAAGAVGRSAKEQEKPAASAKKKKTKKTADESAWSVEDDEPEPKAGKGNKGSKGGDEDLPSFFIQDREVEGGEGAGAGEDKIQSQAEKELYEALQKNKKKQKAAN